MTISKHRIYRLKATLRFGVFEDGGIAFDLQSRASLEMNRSATRILGHLNGEKTLEDVIEALRSKFEPPSDTIEKDLVDFIENLVRKGWLDVQ